MFDMFIWIHFSNYLVNFRLLNYFALTFTVIITKLMLTYI